MAPTGETAGCDAREHLRTAHDMLAAIGMEAFAERARRELAATGEKVRKRTDETRGQLTPQEEQIARLAPDGQTNPEIGAQLFISATHGRVAPAQGVHEARHQLAQTAPRGTSERRARGVARTGQRPGLPTGATNPRQSESERMFTRTHR